MAELQLESLLAPISADAPCGPDLEYDPAFQAMKEVFITSVSPSGGHGGEIIENVSCSYKDIEFAYKAQDDKGGLGGEVKFGWNVATTETR